METVSNSQTGGSSKYWLSLEQWRNDPEFQKLAEQEFQSSPLRENSGEDGFARREFLKLMGASLALTTFGCVRRPAQKIVPYAQRPKEIVLGMANHYASSYQDGSESFGVLVTTREGRPIKIEGLPEHPLNKGGMSARAHAHILSLYDPDRLTSPKRNLLNKEKTNRDTVAIQWEDLDKAVVDQLNKGGVAVLTSSFNSPTKKALLQDFTSAFGATHYVWDAISYEDINEGQALSYGRALVPHLRFDKAKFILAVGGDFLGTYLSPVEFNRQFASGRTPDQGMNKLVVFESLLSLTGGNADERYRVRPSQHLSVLLGLVHDLIVLQGKTRYSSDGTVKNLLTAYSNMAAKLGVPQDKWNEIVEGLWENRGKGLIVTGGLTAQSESALALQIAANFLNSALENEGVTVDSSSAYQGLNGSNSDLQNLIRALNDGKVKTLILNGVNPAYASAKALGFVEALKKAGMVISTSTHMDETALFADIVATGHHDLENWGDMESHVGVYSIQQPTIRPLYDTRAFEDSLIAWAKLAKKGAARLNTAGTWHDYLKENWKNNIYASNRQHSMATQGFDDFWVALLQNGVFDTARNGGSARNFNTSALTKISAAKSAEGYELVLYPTIGLKDGSLANVSWLQEFPDPVTKICWDNYLCLSIKDAEKEKLREGQVVQLTVGTESLEIPVHIQPGQADGTLGLAVGYGRTAAGLVANNVGQNAFALAQAGQGGVVYAGLSAKITATKKLIELANVQGHHSMEGRQIVVEATLEQFKKDKNANIHRHKLFSMWSEHNYTKNKWGMVIDLNTCTGCSACIVACQSENSIPTVGKKYVLQGREMHWIRVDRYYVGEPQDPAVVNQPLVCMHCDNAPCETVCPVAATVHSDEGTNDMIYNRCVGTRYCSNNCPYKVRRFNWFNYVKEVREPLNLAMNPEVTVRDRGVMEKCTFCIHRIKDEKRKARADQRQIKDGDVKTACQQSCPTGAIVFGDLNDESSAVHKAFKAENGYGLLEELETKPAVRYLSKIRNTAELKVDPGHHGHGEGKAHKEGKHS